MDFILKTFYLVIGIYNIIAFVKQSHTSNFKVHLSILYIIQILLISVSLVLELFVVTETVEQDEESILSNPHTDSTKFESKPSSIDNDNWMNTNVVRFQSYKSDNTVINHNEVFKPEIQTRKEVHSHSKSVPNFQFTHSKSHETLIPNLSDNSIHSHIRDLSVLEKAVDEDIQLEDVVRRSKSTGQLHSNQSHRKRWKSINDEKVFLKNINESLLPAVLKTGESPILMLKRQQSQISQTVEEIPPIVIPSTTEHGDLPTPKKTKKKYDLSFEEGDDNSMNLPYISEFDEPVDQSQFKNFDSNFNVEIDETKYKDSLNGLESIPQPVTDNWLSKAKSLNYISLNQWNEHQTEYKNVRVRSGLTLNVAMTNLVDDKNLSSATLINDEYLLPPTDQRADNIDDLSDIVSSTSEKKPMFTQSNRSFSAPSLHTFRNVSNGSQESSNYDQQSIVESVVRYQTPPPIEIQSEEPPISPIKKLLNQSPKRLFRKSVDFKEQSMHKHSGSIISSTFSLHSNSSKSTSPKRSGSRSSSPKRSFKNLLPKKSATLQNLQPNPRILISPTNLLKQAIVKPKIYDEEPQWDLETSKSSNNSRISSLPSAIIGEYDREKWNTLKTLQVQHTP
ncbi:hypothetical protein CLIB1444_02S06458 [[Candida] jaroonii]|uniref:Uncharacterized protein n=1 Tax=[Candida] jaroonii TaxID=467808 RepID=A0ACA9Y348_9ASCO|nr:hypothetical protein CLIB1444_02S06458 [[Candida] jaroonii]